MNWQDYLSSNRQPFETELLDFLRIPSISALPAHAADVRRAGAWVAQRLAAAGMENIETLETGGHPVVYADWLHAPGKPTIMIYGHFDTQPVDPIELWDSPPFEPVVHDGRVYARGASDDKGNMFAPILALEALLKTSGRLPVNVKCFFEGQEEIGSPTLPPFIAANREKFACDFVVSADGGQWAEDQPAIALAFKGLVRAPDRRGRPLATTCTRAGTAAPSRTRSMPWCSCSTRCVARMAASWSKASTTPCAH